MILDRITTENFRNLVSGETELRPHSNISLAATAGGNGADGDYDPPSPGRISSTNFANRYARPFVTTICLR